MSSTLNPPKPSATRRPSTSRRFGYLVTIATNAATLYVARHLLEWNWPAFVTEEFDQVLSIMSVSLMAGILTNAVFFVYDTDWLTSLGGLMTTGISFLVTMSLFQVFPFDFSAYGSDWSWLVRLVLIIAIVGTAIGFMVDLIKFLTWPLRLR